MTNNMAIDPNMENVDITTNSSSSARSEVVSSRSDETTTTSFDAVSVQSTETASMTTLEKMVRDAKKYISVSKTAKDYQLLGLLIEAYEADDEKSKNEAHMVIKKFLDKNKHIYFGKIYKKYLEDYEEFHYRESDGNKYWENSEGLSHRTTMAIVDGVMQTLPAVILSDGTKSWRLNGRPHRTDKGSDGLTLPAEIQANGKDMVWKVKGNHFRDDVDEHGNLLPTEIYRGDHFWNSNGDQHRAELGKNPNDPETFGKALPAIIRANGVKVWKFKGKTMTCEELTKKLRGESEIDCSKATEIHVKMADGNVVKLTGSFTSVQLMSAAHS